MAGDVLRYPQQSRQRRPQAALWHRQRTCTTSTVMKSSTSPPANVGNLQNAFTAELRPKTIPFNCEAVRTRSCVVQHYGVQGAMRREGRSSGGQHVIGPKPCFETIGHALAVALNLRRGGTPLVLNREVDGPHRKGDEVNIRQQ